MIKKSINICKQYERWIVNWFSDVYDVKIFYQSIVDKINSIRSTVWEQMCNFYKDTEKLFIVMNFSDFLIFSSFYLLYYMAVISLLLVDSLSFVEFR